MDSAQWVGNILALGASIEGVINYNSENGSILAPHRDYTLCDVINLVDDLDVIKFSCGSMNGL